MAITQAATPHFRNQRRSSCIRFRRPPSSGGLAGRPKTVAEKRVINLGGTEIDVMFLGRAHTGGDLEVYLPREKILFMSEVFSNRIFPSMANGYPTEWLETLKKAEQMDAAIYVPAHGFIDSPAILREEERTYRSALERVIAEGRRLHDAKVPVDDAAAQSRSRELRQLDAPCRERGRRAEARLHGARWGAAETTNMSEGSR